MSSGQNVVAGLDFAACPCGFEGLVETFTDHEAHDCTWECPTCQRTYTKSIEGEN